MIRLPIGPVPREAFASRHAVLLPDAAEPSLVTTLLSRIARSTWVPDPVTGDQFQFDTVDIDLADIRRTLLTAELLEPLEKLTGVGGIRDFHGQIKRIGPGDRFPWHRDHRSGQKLGVSLCLSTGFDGGAFEIRWRWDRAPLCTLQPRRAGDLHLIDVADERLVHRVTPVTLGERIVLAGWWVS